MRRTRMKPIYVLLATALLGMIVMPIAFAGAANGPTATASASVKKQVKKLKQRVAQLEGKQTPDSLPPSGPAGGDLTGQYPNPLIGPAAIGSDELADDAVTGAKIAPEAVGSPELANNSVVGAKIPDGTITSSEIADAGIQASDIDGNAVGGSQLKGLTAVVSSGTGLNNNTPGNAQVTCPGGGMVIGGGYAWTQDEANSIIASAPSEADPNQTWVVRGMPTGGSSNTLFAWANCLAV